jgi:release factor glutamine methyltransferase
MANGEIAILTVGRAVREMSRAFAEAGFQTSALDARLLTAHATGTGRDVSITNPDLVLGEDMGARLAEVTARRLSGEPVHRIIGLREFYGLGLALGPDTLEPRPDTETLVEAVLPFVSDVAESQGSCRVLDLGTGTGAIGLAIASQIAGARICATDIAPGAVEIANANAAALGLASRFKAIRSDWLSAIDVTFDLIVSNPPYIPASEIETLDSGVRNHDPRLALDGGPDGLDAYRAISRDCGPCLSRGGRIGFEIGAGQAKAVRKIFGNAGFEFVAGKNDLSGIERVIVFQ